MHFSLSELQFLLKESCSGSVESFVDDSYACRRYKSKTVCGNSS